MIFKKTVFKYLSRKNLLSEITIYLFYRFVKVLSQSLKCYFLKKKEDLSTYQRCRRRG